jgi:hypothetical protein
MFNGYQIVDWDFLQLPHSIIWAVRDDGVLLGLTYIKDQAVWGWHRHTTDGYIENVCVVPEGNEDRLYLVVRREIEGVTVRYVERMASRTVVDLEDAIFTDSTLSYDGRNTTATTLYMTGGTDWVAGEALIVLASGAVFAASNADDEVVFYDSDGVPVRFRINNYVSPTEVHGFAHRDVPLELQDAPTATWTLAVDTVTGLEHLEGKDVSVLADGGVVANPNDVLKTVLTVSGGSLTLSRPYGRIYVGLPFIADLQTLDLDVAGNTTVLDRKKLVNRVGVYVEATRGIFAGTAFPTGDDPLEGFDEYKLRETESPDELTQPVTGYLEVNTQATWERHGRVCIRQVDPLPVTVLGIMPIGYL